MSPIWLSSAMLAAQSDGNMLTSFLHRAGRIRKKGEMNGKSGNMNNVLAQIYPTGCFIPGNELIAVFDADQIAKPDFFLRTVSLFDAGDDVGMVSKLFESYPYYLNQMLLCDIALKALRYRSPAGYATCGSLVHGLH